MKIRLKAADLQDALSTITLVKPSNSSAEGRPAGYLFVFEGGSLHIHSPDNVQMAKASIPLIDGKEETGRFVYPYKFVEAFQYTKGEIEFEIGEGSTIRDNSDSGGTSRKGLDNPNLISTFDDDLAVAAAKDKATVPAAILAKAIDLAKPTLRKEEKAVTQNPLHEIVQIFDASSPDWAPGDGTLFAMSGVRAFYFHCPALKGFGLVVHEKRLSTVTSFLSHRSGNVNRLVGNNLVYLESDGHVYGWGAVQQAHPKYAYFSLDKDTVLLDVDKEEMLLRLKYLAHQIPSGHNKISLTYVPEAGEHGVLKIMFDGANEKSGVEVAVQGVEKAKRAFTFNVNVEHLLDLFTSMEANRVTFRVAIVPQPNGKEAALFRTIDEFYLDDAGKVVIDPTQEGIHKCTVTRFLPSK